jgi:hypothetical protein
MKNKIKFNIEIDTEVNINTRIQASIHNTLYQEYNDLLNYDNIKNDFLNLLKKLQKFRMITIDILEDGKYLKGFRIVNNYGEFKASKYNLEKNSFDNFLAIDEKTFKKDFLKLLKEYIIFTNESFLKMIKKETLLLNNY